MWAQQRPGVGRYVDLLEPIDCPLITLIRLFGCASAGARRRRQFLMVGMKRTFAGVVHAVEGADRGHRSNIGLPLRSRRSMRCGQASTGGAGITLRGGEVEARMLDGEDVTCLSGRKQCETKRFRPPSSFAVGSLGTSPFVDG